MALLTMVVLSCKEEKPAKIRLCSDIRPANPCIGEDSVFMQGKNVWAQLWLGRNFDDTAVIANLYGYPAYLTPEMQEMHIPIRAHITIIIPIITNRHLMHILTRTLILMKCLRNGAVNFLEKGAGGLF